MSSKHSHHILAFYQFASLSDPHAEVARHKIFFAEHDVRGRIYLSEQGINGGLSASPDIADAYQTWLKAHSSFRDIEFKVHFHHEHVFPKMIVKYRKELVALGEMPNMAERGQYLSPDEWKSAFDNEEDFLLLDVRNEYEWKVGRFEGARLPPCDTFREFNRYADELKREVDPKRAKVLMYCTGGIRCELYSAVLKQRGFEQVFQLKGGVINYGLKEGSSHWEGKLFVFDDRLTAPISDEPSPVVGHCHHCGALEESYYNCANVDCNELFLCCPSCIETFKGCCSSACSQAKRVRPYKQQGPHKPFRRWYHYTDKKEDLYEGK